MVIAVAIDENVQAITDLSEGISYPVLMDPNHILTELYAISNVPSVVWIDENDKIVRPAAVEFGTNTFTEITGISRETHMQQVRNWVHDQIVPEDAAFTVPDLTEEEVLARLHFRLAAHLQRTGQTDDAETHFDLAAELAPLDFTIVRASMPLRGQDPFGEKFFELYEKYLNAGSPYHGIPRNQKSD